MPLINLAANTGPRAIPKEIDDTVRQGASSTLQVKCVKNLSKIVAENSSELPGKAKRHLKLHLTIPKGIESGELLGSGLCGDVRRDVDHKGFVLKSFTRFSKDDAQRECQLFLKVYGEGSAEVVEKNDSVYLRMLEVPGKALVHCISSELPSNADELFLRMIADLNEVGIIHGDLHSGNIMYDYDSNRFWPIDLSNAYDAYYEESHAGRKFMDIDNQKRFEQIMSKLIK